MREFRGNMWDYFLHRDEKNAHFILCITTNCTVKWNGQAVMGKGCAKEAAQKIPGIAKHLGEFIDTFGPNAGYFAQVAPKEEWAHKVIVFPVKYQYWLSADLDLIRGSALWLRTDATINTNHIYILPRPGCGAGGRKWREVYPLVQDLPDNVWVIDK